MRTRLTKTTPEGGPSPPALDASNRGMLGCLRVVTVLRAVVGYLHVEEVELSLLRTSRGLRDAIISDRALWVTFILRDLPSSLPPGCRSAAASPSGPAQGASVFEPILGAAMSDLSPSEVGAAFDVEDMFPTGRRLYHVLALEANFRSRRGDKDSVAVLLGLLAVPRGQSSIAMTRYAITAQGAVPVGAEPTPSGWWMQRAVHWCCHGRWDWLLAYHARSAPLAIRIANEFRAPLDAPPSHRRITRPEEYRVAYDRRIAADATRCLCWPAFNALADVEPLCQPAWITASGPEAACCYRRTWIIILMSIVLTTIYCSLWAHVASTPVPVNPGAPIPWLLSDGGNIEGGSVIVAPGASRTPTESGPTSSLGLLLPTIMTWRDVVGADSIDAMVHLYQRVSFMISTEMRSVWSSVVTSRVDMLLRPFEAMRPAVAVPSAAAGVQEGAATTAVTAPPHTQEDDLVLVHSLQPGHHDAEVSKAMLAGFHATLVDGYQRHNIQERLNVLGAEVILPALRFVFDVIYPLGIPPLVTPVPPMVWKNLTEEEFYADPYRFEGRVPPLLIPRILGFVWDYVVMPLVRPFRSPPLPRDANLEDFLPANHADSGYMGTIYVVLLVAVVLLGQVLWSIVPLLPRRDVGLLIQLALIGVACLHMVFAMLAASGGSFTRFFEEFRSTDIAVRYVYSLFGGGAFHRAVARMALSSTRWLGGDHAAANLLGTSSSAFESLGVSSLFFVVAVLVAGVAVFLQWECEYRRRRRLCSVVGARAPLWPGGTLEVLSDKMVLRAQAPERRRRHAHDKNPNAELCAPLMPHLSMVMVGLVGQILGRLVLLVAAVDAFPAILCVVTGYPILPFICTILCITPIVSTVQLQGQIDITVLPTILSALWFSDAMSVAGLWISTVKLFAVPCRYVLGSILYVFSLTMTPATTATRAAATTTTTSTTTALLSSSSSTEHAAMTFHLMETLRSIYSTGWDHGNAVSLSLGAPEDRRVIAMVVMFIFIIGLACNGDVRSARWEAVDPGRRVKVINDDDGQRGGDPTDSDETTYDCHDSNEEEVVETPPRALHRRHHRIRKRTTATQTRERAEIIGSGKWERRKRCVSGWIQRRLWGLSLFLEAPGMGRTVGALVDALVFWMMLVVWSFELRGHASGDAFVSMGPRQMAFSYTVGSVIAATVLKEGIGLGLFWCRCRVATR